MHNLRLPDRLSDNSFLLDLFASDSHIHLGHLAVPYLSDHLEGEMFQLLGHLVSFEVLELNKINTYIQLDVIAKLRNVTHLNWKKIPDSFLEMKY